jgi:hypothetical protein
LKILSRLTGAENGGVFFPAFHPYKTILLPGQARDKHREDLKESVFRFCRAMFGAGHVAHELVYFFNTSFDRQRAADVSAEDALKEECRCVRKTTLFGAGLYRDDRFAKTGSGQT